jgi:hypothetical protein
MTTKPFGAVSKVNAAVVHGKMMFLLGEICSTSGGGLTGKKTSKAILDLRRAPRNRGCQRLRLKPTANGRINTAHCAAMRGVMGQKSAEAIVVAQAMKGRTVTDKEEP